MAALLSPLQLQAGASLLQNQGIAVSANLTAKITEYQSLSLISPLRDTITTGSSILANATIASLETFASNSCPALADAVPSAYISTSTYPVTTTFPVTSLSTTDPGLTGVITSVANSYLGNGDISKFAQIFSTAQGYVTTTNVFINSAVNAQTYLADTFTDMDNLMSGDLTQVNLDTKNFGQDLQNLGQAIDLSNLDNFGTPLALIRQITKLAGITTPLIVALTDVGVNENIVLSLNNPELTVTDTVQKAMYSALTMITGDDLSQMLTILGVTTAGITSLADLLDPCKIFPNSYTTLTVPVCQCKECVPTGDDMDIGTVFFQTRQPPDGQPTVYPITDIAWSSFMNTNAVWESTFTGFETRNPPAGQATAYPQSYPAWSSFMNANAVWESDILAPNFKRSYTITIGTAGMFTFTAQCDNYATISIDGNQVLYVNGFQGAPLVTEVYISAGTHTLTIDAVNAGSYSGGNPGGVALTISVAQLAASFSRTYTITIPVTGTYVWTGQADNLADFSLDGNIVLSSIGFTGTPDTALVEMTQGTHTIELDGTNSSGPGGIALTIASAFSSKPQKKCSLRGIYIPNATGIVSGPPKLTEVEYNYRRLFGRESDPEGYQYWANSGLTGAALISAMVDSASPADATTYAKRKRQGTFPLYQPSKAPPPTGSVTGVVNSKLETELPDTTGGITYLRLSKIIPPDQALADRALVISLQQITNINRMSLPALAAAYLGVETNRDLPYINAQYRAVPQDAIDYFLNGLAIGSGPDGTILLTDIIGTAIGTNQTDNLTTVIDTIDNLSGSLSDLIDIYTTMLGVVDGDFPDPANPPDGIEITTGNPGAGIYTDADSAILALIALAQAEITAIQIANQTDTSNLNTAFIAMANQMARESNFQNLATLVIGELTGNSQASTQTLVFALPSYGADTSQGGTAEYLESAANLTLPGGQALVACLREGRNKTALNESGVGTANNVNSDPETPPPTAELIPSEYTQTEALARIVT